jgi:hypothetical protein
MKQKTVILILVIIIIMAIALRKPIQKALSRGYANCNPGNIRLDGTTWQGEIKGTDKDFKTFSSMAYGYRAMFKILHTYLFNLDLNNVRQVISVYAPSSENDTDAYVNDVSQRAGLDPDELLNWDANAVDVVAAMSYHENGITPDMQEVTAGFNLATAT